MTLYSLESGFRSRSGYRILMMSCWYVMKMVQFQRIGFVFMTIFVNGYMTKSTLWHGCLCLNRMKGAKMSNLIDRNEAEQAIAKYSEDSTAVWRYMAKKLLKDVPSVQHKGRIIIRTNMLGGEDCYCSECDHLGLLPDYKVCPYCGVEFEDVISECRAMEEFMYGQNMGNPEDGSL